MLRAPGSPVPTRRSFMAQPSDVPPVDPAELPPELAAALAREPSQRQAASVQGALNWWLQGLPALGSRLAPELDSPGDELPRAFARGRLAVYGPGDRLVGEGDEARHYVIVLTGSWRLRCRAPAPKTGVVAKGGKAAKGEDKAVEEEDPLAAVVDEEGMVLVGHLRRGEPLGLAPGEARSPWDVSCAERSIVLLLSSEDYNLTLRPFHRQLQADAARFLMERGICSQTAGATTVQRFAQLLRLRPVLRGAALLSAGQLQRQIYILRDGSVSLLAPPQARLPGEGETAADDEGAEGRFTQDEEIEREILRRERLRQYSMEGGAKQLQGAADEARNEVLKNHARGALGKTLRGESGAKPAKSLGVAARKDGLVPTAVVTEPGTVLGEEVLLYETFRELATACSCYTIVANEDSLCYSLDLTAFQKLANLMGAELLLEKVKDKFSRHLDQHARCKRSAMQMSKDCRRYKRNELRRQERQTLKLPPSYPGAQPLDALESTDDWLSTVLSYRKPPANRKAPGTLNCLSTLGLDPLTFQSGPGVSAMLQVFNNPVELNALRDGLRYRKNGMRLEGDSNPMGELVQKDARYEEALPPSAECPALPPPEEPENVDSGLGGVFFCTEVDEVRLSIPVPGGSPPDRGGGSPQVTRSSSVPVLPRIPSSQSCGQSASPEATLVPSDFRTLSSKGRSGSSPGIKASTSRKGAGSTREALVAKTFYRAVVGKSILVFTDKADTRKSILKGLQSALTEFEMTFVKTVTDLWTRLNSPKETYHTLILDLTKTELQADPLLRTVRQHQRYGRLPILVLSADRELSETVKSSCSFVVFHPVSAPMLREGLLWCFDKKALTSKGRSQAAARDLEQQALGDGMQANFALLAHTAPISVS